VNGNVGRCGSAAGAPKERGRRDTCRETEGTQDDDGKRTLLCHQRREGVTAGGCTWRTHVLTDGTLQRFAIAGWADAACPLETCTTHR
jgi:hypothetical protein